MFEIFLYGGTLLTFILATITFYIKIQGPALDIVHYNAAIAFKGQSHENYIFVVAINSMKIKRKKNIGGNY